jgi:hypothetical protein
MNGPTSLKVTLAAATAMGITKNTAMYTDSIDIQNMSGFALSTILTGTGAVSCKIELQQSYQRPATEGAADGSYVVPTGISDIISNLAVKTQSHIALSPVYMRYIRFKITELTNVSTDTVAVMMLNFSNTMQTM